MAALVLDLLADLVAPTRCAACDDFVRRDVLFCVPCGVGVEEARELPGRRARAVYEYGGAIASAIMRFKYGGRSDLAGRLAAPMADLAVSDPLLRRAEIVVPVPLHPRRVVERGFDQSALLAKPIARRLRVPWGIATVARTKETPKQATLDRGARLANVSNAFVVVRPEAIAGRAVLLIDDVCTTGATLEACASALSKAGAKVVSAVVMASASGEKGVFP